MSNQQERSNFLNRQLIYAAGDSNKPYAEDLIYQGADYKSAMQTVCNDLGNNFNINQLRMLAKLSGILGVNGRPVGIASKEDLCLALSEDLEETRRSRDIPSLITKPNSRVLVIGGGNYGWEPNKYQPIDNFFIVGGHTEADFGANLDWREPIFWTKMTNYLSSHRKFDAVIFDSGSESWLPSEASGLKAMADAIASALAPNGIILVDQQDVFNSAMHGGSHRRSDFQGFLRTLNIVPQIYVRFGESSNASEDQAYSVSYRSEQNPDFLQFLKPNEFFLIRNRRDIVYPPVFQKQPAGWMKWIIEKSGNDQLDFLKRIGLM